MVNENSDNLIAYSVISLYLCYLIESADRYAMEIRDMAKWKRLKSGDEEESVFRESAGFSSVRTFYNSLYMYVLGHASIGHWWSCSEAKWMEGGCWFGKKREWNIPCTRTRRTVTSLQERARVNQCFYTLSYI